MKIQYFVFFFFVTLLFGCIKDDFVLDGQEPELRISNSIDSLTLDSSYQFELTYFNNIGVQEVVPSDWRSAESSIIQISNQGLAKALSAGSTWISCEVETENGLLKDSTLVHVGENTVANNAAIMGSIRTTSSYKLEGDFTLKTTQTGVELTFSDNYSASTALPGLYIYLSNNRNSIANALEVAKVTVFNGAHEYVIDEVTPTDYKYIVYFCKPFNVKVGDGELKS